MYTVLVVNQSQNLDPESESSGEVAEARPPRWWQGVCMCDV